MAGALKTSTKEQRRGRFVLLVLASCACLGVAPIGAVGTLFSPLVFDERGNLLNPLAWIGFLLMITFWIVCLLAPFAAWVFWRREREQMAWTAISVPLIWAVALVTVLQFVPG